MQRGTGALPHVYPYQLAEIPFPVIDIQVQQKIVEFLDTSFASHEATLSAMKQEYEVTKKYQKSIFREVMKVKEKVP